MELRQHASQELSVLIDRLVTDADARTDARIEEMRHGHHSALAALRLKLDEQSVKLDEQSLELDARAAALDQLTASLGDVTARLDRNQLEFDLQRGELEVAQRKAATVSTASDRELRDARTALDSARAETARLNRQFEGALEELRAEHVATLQEQALARTILPLEELLTVFDALATASTPSAVLSAVVSGLSREFSRVALFRLRSGRLECVSHVGFEFEGDIAKVVIPSSVDSLMTRALSSRRTQTFLSGTSDEPCTAPFGGTPACAVALPLVSGDATVAVIYADDSDQLEFGSVPAALLVKFAELVWQHAILVLQRASGAQKTLAVKPAQRFDRLA